MTMHTAGRILVALIAWGALSFGAVYPWGYWPLAIGCAAIGGWAMVITRAWREPRPRLVAIALGLIAAALLIQVIPFPRAVVGWLSPAAEPLHGQLQVGWGLRPPASLSLSIAPEGTATALLLFLAFGALLVGLMRAMSYLPREWLVSQLAIFGLVMALFGIIQRVVSGPGDIPVYGFWRPEAGYATPFGPFINSNHFAGWMLLVLPLAVAYASAQVQQARGPFLTDWRSWFRWLATPDASRFLFLAIAILIMAIALVLTGSRSGLGSFIVATAVLAYFAARRAHGRTRRVLPAFYLVLLVIAAVGWVGVDFTVARFEHASAELGERATAWRDTWSIFRDFPVTGLGFGGYGQAMLVYQTAERHSIYLQAHNEYLQILAEGGVLVALPVLLTVVILAINIRHRLRGHDDAQTYWLRAGAVAGLAGIATQSLLDFSLQMPGNAMMCAVVLALALHRPASVSHAHRV